MNLLIAYFGFELDEWMNFEERINDPKLGSVSKDRNELIREWVSYRGQTLYRTGLDHIKNNSVTATLLSPEILLFIFQI